MKEKHKNLHVAFRRIGDEPLISPSKLPWEAGGAFAPAVARFDGKFRMLYRAYGTDRISRLGYAESTDGIHWKKDDKPKLVPANRYEAAGMEDPRVSVIDGKFYTCYTAVRGKIGHLRTQIRILETSDFHKFRRISTKIRGQWRRNDKDAVLFPETFNGKYKMLHRIPPDIEVSTSDNLVKWVNPTTVLEPTEEKWESLKVGSGPPPLLCELGWLLFYHGVSDKDVYSMGAVILDKVHPYKVRFRLPYPILTPEREYEKVGVVPNVVFGTSALEIGDSYWMYYGAADNCIAAAKINKDELLDALQEYPVFG